MLSITDHDTLGAYAEITSIPTEMQLICGIEISSQWRGQGIHIVGLNVDMENNDLNDTILQLSQIRIQRAEKIAYRLGRLGFANCMEGAAALATNQIGRPHFAQYLANIGAVKDTSEAFKKYLGAGKLGDVKEHWPNIEMSIKLIRQAGGIAVLAHPSKYKMTRSKLTSLISDFRDSKGQAIEVVSGLQIPSVTRDLAKLSRQFNLLASCGSDFHSPEKSWASLGKTSHLPDMCQPVWSQWR
jgi:hypothetical protein